MSSPPSSPNKRPKIENSENNLHHNPPSPSPSEDNDDESMSDCCGICYGASMRGEIDCCDHFFCFVCIMEWSKHESRCPLCRQRFSSVKRPHRPGLFSSSRLVKIPIRDQVYHAHGNITTGPVDPYAETRCSVCNGGEDECFLLLCDLCDTASHTYCVGLGHVVPEGDWFCQDCSVSRAMNDNNNVEDQCDVPSAEPSVSIIDIVREPDSQIVRRLRPSPLVTPVPDRINRNKDRHCDMVVNPLPLRVNRNKGRNHDISARTLHRCRNVQRSIKSFRANWNALRNGSLRFSSSADYVVRHDKRKNNNSLSHEKSDQLHSSASTSLQQSAIQSCSSNTISSERGSEDVDKAWKMLDRVRRLEKTNQEISILPQGLDHPLRVAGPSKAPIIHCKDQGLKIHEFGRSMGNQKRYSFSSFDKDMDNRRPLELEVRKRTGVTHKGTTSNIRDQAPHLQECCEPSLRRKSSSSILCIPHHVNGERKFSKKQSRSSCLETSVGSALSDGKIGSVSSSSRDAGENKPMSKNFRDASMQESENAKNEIKSLVKLNLKALSKDKILGVDAFKKIARHSTHAILAACQSEHQKPGTSSSSTLCSHRHDNEHSNQSTLMPNCCRLCFNMFVRNVVSSTMMEKVGGGASSSS